MLMNTRVCVCVDLHVALTARFLFLPSPPLSWQFCASSAKEAEEWVKQIDFVLRGQRSLLGLSKIEAINPP